MNRTRPLTRAILGATAAGAATLALATTAAAEPVDYSESIALSWDGVHYTTSTAHNFLGTPMIVPGDASTGTLLVRNDGPTSGTLRASIVNVQILHPEAPDVHHNPDHPGAQPDGEGNFYDDLALSWEGGSASFTELDAGGRTEILQVDLEEGEQVPITLSYGFGVEATSGNRANVDPRLASFDVLLEIGGDLPAEPPVEEPDPGAPPPQTAPPPPSGPPPQTGPPTLQHTGIGGATWVLVLAAIALGTGAALRFGTRRTTSDAGR